jgi:hypothetical protein
VCGNFVACACPALTKLEASIMLHHHSRFDQLERIEDHCLEPMYTAPNEDTRKATVTDVKNPRIQGTNKEIPASQVWALFYSPTEQTNKKQCLQWWTPL